MTEAERAAYEAMSPEERKKFMRQKGVVGEGLSAAAIAALPAEQKALYDGMTEAEKAAFASMSEEEKAAYAAMSPEERAKAMRQAGIVGEPLSAAALASLPDEQKKLYESMSEAERAAFASMSEEERAKYAAMSPEERAAAMAEMGVAEIKVDPLMQSGSGPGVGLSKEEMANLTPEQLKAYEGMSAAERAAYAGMTEEQRKAFESLSPEEREKMMNDLGYPQFFEGSGGPGTRDIAVQWDGKAQMALNKKARRGGDDDGAGKADADADGANGKKRRRRNRGKPMITSLKGAKAVPAWMLHKTVGTMMQARVEYELEMAARGESEDDNQVLIAARVPLQCRRVPPSA